MGKVWERLKEHRHTRAVVVVAHPDDETLWCGGTIAHYTRWVKWTVICCSTPIRDPIRAGKFIEACETLGARPRLISIPEGGKDASLKPNFAHIPDLSGYDVIMTHGAAGEYGHKHHIELHKHIIGLYPDKTLAIGYRLNGIKGENKMVLTEHDKAVKLQALMRYDHPTGLHSTGLKPTWQCLLEEFGGQFDLDCESYDG